MAKKQIPKRRGRVAQPSYMSPKKFLWHCRALGLNTDGQVAAFFKVHISTAFHWRHGSCPISASTAMLLRVMVTGFGADVESVSRLLER
jgi:hypothetical protein